MARAEVDPREDYVERHWKVIVGHYAGHLSTGAMARAANAKPATVRKVIVESWRRDVSENYVRALMAAR